MSIRVIKLPGNPKIPVGHVKELGQIRPGLLSQQREWKKNACRAAWSCWTWLTSHLFEPQQLRGLQLWGHDPSDPGQDPVAASRDASGLLFSTVVHPHHHVLLPVTCCQGVSRKHKFLIKDFILKRRIASQLFSLSIKFPVFCLPTPRLRFRI